MQWTWICYTMKKRGRQKKNEPSIKAFYVLGLSFLKIDEGWVDVVPHCCLFSRQYRSMVFFCTHTLLLLSVSKGLTVALFHWLVRVWRLHALRLKRRWKLSKPQCSLEPLTLRCCVNLIQRDERMICLHTFFKQHNQHLVFLKPQELKVCICCSVHLHTLFRKTSLRLVIL